MLVGEEEVGGGVFRMYLKSHALDSLNYMFVQYERINFSLTRRY